MADPNSSLNVLTNINWPNVIAGIPGVQDLVFLGKAVGIAVLVYITFLIIRSIVQIRYSLRFKKLTNNVEEINRKMDILIGKQGKKWEIREEAKEKKKR